MSVKYSGNVVPTLSNAPASGWSTDAEKRAHTKDLYLVTGTGGSAGNVYEFCEYPVPAQQSATTGGDIVTINDGGENLPVVDAKVTFTPVQDLNGYDNPWPGGGGKNLFDKDNYTGYNLFISVGSTSINSANDPRMVVVPVKENTTYTVSKTVDSNALRIGFGTSAVPAQNVTLLANAVGITGTECNLLTATSPTGATYMYIQLYANNATYLDASYYVDELQVEEGSEATAWEPYANICPITGYSDVTVTRTGKNLFDTETIYAGYIQPDGSVLATGMSFLNIRYSIPQVLVGKTLTFSAMLQIPSGSTLTSIRTRAYVNDHQIMGNTITSSAYTLSKVTFTATSTNDYVGLTSGSNSGQLAQAKDIQLEIGSSATDYEAYDGESVTIDLGGTRYGGTLDVTTGVLTVTHASFLLGDVVVSKSTSNYQTFVITPPSAMATGTAKTLVLCDIAEGKAQDNISSSGDCYVWGSSNAGTIRLKMTAYEGVTSTVFKTTFASSQFVYELATPLTVQLTAEEITTAYLKNYFWTDMETGTISNLVYQSMYFTKTFNWLETWTMPKITTSNGTIYVLPYPQEYTPEIYDVDAATTGRNAAGTMIRDRVARKHKFNYKWAALSQTELSEILNAIKGVSFTLTTADPETGAKTNYTVYPGNRSMPVYWYPSPQSGTWMYASLSANLIEM